MFHELIDGLRAGSPSKRAIHEIDRLLKQASGQWIDTKPLLTRPGTYTRTCVYLDEDFEVLLLNWVPGAVSAIHDHGDQHCWMTVLSGSLQIDDFVRLDTGTVTGYAHVEAQGSRVLEAGGVDARAGRFDLHRVAALHSGPAVSLHIYSAPIRHYLIYDQLARRCETARGTYDQVLSNHATLLRA